MKKRLMSLCLILALFAGLLPAMPIEVQAVDGANQNAYGTPTTYEPVTELYMKSSDAEPVRFLDASMTHWLDYAKSFEVEKKKGTGHEAVSWLTSEGYLLNRYLRYDHVRNNKDYHLPDLTTGFINTRSNDRIRHNLVWNSDGLRLADFQNENLDLQENQVGNVLNMLKKNDIQYKFSCTLFNKDWIFWEGGIRDSRSADVLELNTPTEQVQKNVHNYGMTGFHCATNGFPDIAEEGKFSNWTESALFDQIELRHNVSKPETGINYSILVGRDVKGPMVEEVWASSDPAGKNRLIGDINLKQIADLEDRTIYFHLKFNEPVKFRDSFSRSEIDDLTLMVSTKGLDNTDAVEAAAKFLHFAPGKMEAMPVMTFEYRILDPYNPPAGMSDSEKNNLDERGKKYKFQNLIVNTSMNKLLYDNLVDLSGNPYGLYMEEKQKTEASLSAAAKENELPRHTTEIKVSGNVGVDLFPYHVEQIEMFTDPVPPKGSGGYVALGGTLGVRLKLGSKLQYWDSLNDSTRLAPMVTLNLLDENNQPVVLGKDFNTAYRKDFIRNEWRTTGLLTGNWDNQSGLDKGILSKVSIPGRISKTEREPYGQEKILFSNDFVEYNMQLVPGEVHLPEGETIIRVVKITARDNGRLCAESGNELMDYVPDEENPELLKPVLPEELVIKDENKRAKLIRNYRRGQDKDYVLDFEGPTLSLNIAQTKDPTILEVKAEMADDHLAAGTISYQFSVEDPPLENPMEIQATTSQGVDGTQWLIAKGVHPGITGAIQPMDGKNGISYAYLKFPTGCDVHPVGNFK